MDPFFVLGVTLVASDEEVARRYHELLRRYPPDRAPDQFRLVRQAFEALRDRRGRLHSWLFSFDATGRSLVREPLLDPEPEHRRIPAAELVALLRQALQQRLQAELEKR